MSVPSIPPEEPYYVPFRRADSNTSYSSFNRGGRLRQRKPIRKFGKIAKSRMDRRRQWVEEHPPTHEGFYTCHLCKREVHISEMELDHVLPKSGTPKATAEHDDNLKPAHALGNQTKGSRRIDESADNSAFCRGLIPNYTV